MILITSLVWESLAHKCGSPSRSTYPRSLAPGYHIRLQGASVCLSVISSCLTGPRSRIELVSNRYHFPARQGGRGHNFLNTVLSFNMRTQLHVIAKRIKLYSFLLLFSFVFALFWWVRALCLQIINSVVLMRVNAGSLPCPVCSASTCVQKCNIHLFMFFSVIQM